MHTKILATLGPKCESREIIVAMIRAGMDIARINFSHATKEQFLRLKKIVLEESKRQKKVVKIFYDLQGPRIRVGMLPPEGIPLGDGQVYVFSHRTNGTKAIPIDDVYLHLDIKKGEPFYLANGALELEVIQVKGEQIIARCLKGGILFSRKAINIPKTTYHRGALTRKDILDATFGIRENVDYLGLSFVQTADDVLRLRKLVGKKPIKIISKIERAVALENIDQIIQVSDGIVIARGDLGIEIPMEDLPIVQKSMISHSHWYGKPVIVATQMLMSMVDHVRPSRADVSDIANAVFERADGVWLSDETASGNYPVECVHTMRKIVTRIEQYQRRENLFQSHGF